MDNPAPDTGNALHGDIIFIKNNELHTISKYSALALLVAAILADNPYHPVAPDDLAVAADTLDGCTYFHVFTPDGGCT